MEDVSELGAARLGPGYTSGTRATSRAVHVSLDALYGAPPDDEPEERTGAACPACDRRRDQRAAFAGVDGQRSVRRPGRLICSGEVPGILAAWERDVAGRWVAIVSFTIPFTPGDPRPGKRMELVAVPLEAVRPADADSPPPQPPVLPPTPPRPTSDP